MRTTNDNGVPLSSIGGAAVNADVRPQHVLAIVTCVGRWEHLRQTLTHNAALVGQLVVVTHPEDQPTLDVVKAWPAATLVLSDSCFAGGHAFNKGRMINAALATLEGPDWILLTDADVLLPPELPEFIRSHPLDQGVLYGTGRNESSETGWNATMDDKPSGFFQLFHSRARALAGRWPRLMCEEFCSAGGVDSWFQQQFPPAQRHMLSELAVTHLTHFEAATTGPQWNGPPRSGQWRQFALLTKHGPLFIEALPPARAGQWRVRLVDTLFGQVWEGVAIDGQQLPSEVVETSPQGITWLGRPIGNHHIHCAYWRD